SLTEQRGNTGAPAGITGLIEYASDLFDPATIEALIARWVRLLHAITTDPDQPISRIDLLTTGERHQLLSIGGDTAVSIPVVCLPELFETQVVATPRATAVVFEDTQWSYAQLNTAANQLAHALIARGIGPERLVAIALPRCPQLVVAILAVLKTGAAYLPLDPDYPPARISFMLTDARPAVLLASASITVDVPDTGLTARLVMDDADTLKALQYYPSTNPTDTDRISPLLPQHPAYVIYTSGSTGTPKGVVVTHHNVVWLFVSTDHWFGFNADDTWTLFHSYAFDSSVWEMWGALLYGGRLIIVSYEVSRSPAQFLRLLVDQGVTVLHQTASAFYQLMQADVDDPTLGQSLVLRTVTFGGEALTLSRLGDWYHRHRDHAPTLVNMYGITETTVHVTYLQLDHGITTQTASLIGTAIPNLRSYVLDSGLQPVVPGVVGELYVGGLGLARGYLGRAALTAARFVADPFGPVGTRMYRTGDLARWRVDGSLEFAGRVDDQVKIRGFRVEPGEIETVLADHPHIAHAAVIARQDRPGDVRLVAYVVTTGKTTVSTQVLRQWVRARAPEYMVPAAFVALEALPLTTNGKLDRAALPAPEFDWAGRGRAPRTPQEQLLGELFAEVLGVSRVGVDDDFFALGGHSLLATRLVARVRATLSVELELRALFETPTPAGLATRLGEAGQARLPVTAGVRPDVVPLSFAQRRLWFLHRLEGPSATYHIPLALRLSGPLDQTALQTALGDVIARHESLRTVFPEREGVPYQQILDADAACPPLVVTPTSHTELPERLAVATGRGFDLGTEAPVRAQLFVLAPEEQVLLVVVHHIAADGWSMRPLLADLATAYAARCHGQAPHWAPLPVQYGDYTLWQHHLLGDHTNPDSLFTTQVAYWTHALADLPDQLVLPTDRPRPAIATYRGAQLTVDLDATLHHGLVNLARHSGASVFMVLHAGLAALLTRLGAGTDIPVGSPIAGRTDQALDDLVGFFVNTLVLRTDTTGDPSFTQLLARVRETALGAYTHQDLPFEHLVEVLNPTRSLAHHPLFQIMLTLQNAPDPTLDLPGLHTSLQPVDLSIAKFDLGLSLTEQRGNTGAPAGITGLIEYASDLFDPATIEALIARWVRLL
ncbi:MAG: amino acid adenylation domain-containing protein, partial [Pseudonocardiaceae bacterium]